MNPILYDTTPEVMVKAVQTETFYSKANRSAEIYSFLAEAVTLGPITSEEP